MFQRSALPLCAALVWLAGAATAVAAPDPQEPPAAAAPAVLAVAVFPVPPEIRPAVAFWTEVYARYTSQQTVLHDSERLDVVYGVLDFSELSRTPMNEWQRARTRTNAEELEKERIRNLLREIALYADRPERLTPEQRRIFELFPEEPGFRVTGARFLEAADRVRGQVGQRDRFMEGIRTSGRYLPEIERIFQQEGVPIELSRLAFVESMFNLNARSAVGASGVWQFMRSTGRLYLRVDDLVDERNDPLLAARAAARLLADNYADLKSWPLAVTAYNHGKYGMLRAVGETGSREIARIVAEYRGPAFGFASRNFYAEFLAALHVERNARRYFGAVPVEPPPSYDLVAMPGSVGVADLARRARLEIEEVRALNPGLTDRALRTNRPLPRGYALRVPSDRRPRLVAARFSVRPGWRPGVTVAAAAAADIVSAGRPAVAPTSGPLAVLHADHRERLRVVTPEPPRLDPELYRAQLMAAEEEALGLFLTAVIDDRSVEDAGVPATPPGLAGAQGTQAAAAPEAGTDLRDRAAPPEASGDRLVGAAVEALEASQPQPPAEMPAAEPAERVVRPGSRVVPSVTTPVPVFGTTVRGGETAWRLAEWSGESLEAFRARNRLGPDQSLPAGRPVSISTAVVSREAFEARRAAFHEALRDKAAREFTVTGTRPHRLEPGQTPWRVAETNRVPFWLLEQTNPDRDLSALKAGDTLLVPIIKK